MSTSDRYRTSEYIRALHARLNWIESLLRRMTNEPEKCTRSQHNRRGYLEVEAQALRWIMGRAGIVLETGFEFGWKKRKQGPEKEVNDE